MQFSEILGQEHIKNHLTKVQKWVEFHAQLFVGPEGSGTLDGYCLCTVYFMRQSEWRTLVLMKPAT
jgi:DNA polymerase III delta prime subunit